MVQNEALKNLAEAAKQGKLELIHLLQTFKSQQKQDPNFLKDCSLYAEACQEYSLAIDFLDQALLIVPNHPILLHNKALNCAQLDQNHQADVLYQNAIQADPHYALAYLNWGLLDEKLFQYQAAIKKINQALRLDPQLINAHLALIRIYEREGEYAASQAHIQAALSLQPNHPLALCYLGRLHYRKKEFSLALESLEHALQVANSQKQIKKEIYFELGHTYHALAKYDKAWTAYQTANDLIPKNPQFKIDFLKDVTDLKIWFAQNTQTSLFLDAKKPPIIFIVGSPRSGTSLCAQILDCHSQIHNEGETQLSAYLIQEARSYLNKNANFIEILKQLFHDQDFEKHMQEHAGLLLQQMTSFHQRCIPLDKIPSNVWRMPFLAKIFPHAFFIHMIRDGRETAFSNFTQNFDLSHWHATNIYDCLLEWQTGLSLAELSCENLTLRYQKVKYEDLVMQTEEEIRKILNFLNLNWEAACLDFHKNKKNSNTASYAQVSQKIYTHALNKLKHYPNIYQKLTDLARQELKKYGYLDD